MISRFKLNFTFFLNSKINRQMIIPTITNSTKMETNMKSLDKNIVATRRTSKIQKKQKIRSSCLFIKFIGEPIEG